MQAMRFREWIHVLDASSDSDRILSSAALDPVSEDLSEDSSNDNLCIISVNVKQRIHAFLKPISY